MKKIISMLLVLTLMVGLAACGGSSNDTTPSGNNPAETQNQGGATGQTQLETKPQESGFSGEITEELLRSWPETPATEFSYEKSLNYEGIRVETYMGSDNIVVIPAEIDGEPVVEVASYCFANDSIVQGVMIPETVKEISELFINNKSVEVVIAEGVQVFGYASFHNCPTMRIMVMGDCVTEIGSMCFFGCEALQELHIPATLTQMTSEAEAVAFAACPNMTIYGEVGSYIETVANQQGIPFVAE